MMCVKQLELSGHVCLELEYFPKYPPVSHN